MMVDDQLVALYEIKRQSFLIGYIQSPDRFSDSLAFAYFHRIAPIFHENSAREVYDSDPFEAVYAVKAEFVRDVLNYIDQRDLEGDLAAIGFYNLEDMFGGYKVNRVELIYALEYARIDGRFGENVWKAIEGNAPTEANSLAASFSPRDVHFN